MDVLKLLISVLEKIYDSLLECGAALCWSILDVILLIVSDEDSVDGSEVRRITGMLQDTRTVRKILDKLQNAQKKRGCNSVKAAFWDFLGSKSQLHYTTRALRLCPAGAGGRIWCLAGHRLSISH